MGIFDKMSGKDDNKNKLADEHALHGLLLMAQVMESDDTNKAESAFSEFEKAIEYDPKCGDAHFGLGRFFHMKSDLNNAIKEYQIAIQCKPDKT